MASSTTARAREVIAELDQLEVDMHLVNQWVHGADNMTVLLGGVSTPTIKNLVKNFWLSAQEILDAAEYIQDNYEGLEDIVDANREYAEIAETLLLRIADWMARDLAEFNAINIELYDRWYDHGIEEIRDANLVAMQAKQNIRDLIDAYDESTAQHRLQIRLFDGTNPGASSKPVLFVISGQSNAVGRGGHVFDRAKDCGMYWSWADGADELKPLADPTGQTVSGENGARGDSGWPSFARMFFALTGRKVILLNIASGGSTVTDAGSTNENTWADNAYGTLRSSRTAIWNAFNAAVPASSYVLGAILWCQGENDANRLYAGSITVADYIGNWTNLSEGTKGVLQWTRNLIGASSCPIFLSKIGYNGESRTSSEWKAAYDAIHEAQNGLIDYENIYPGFSLAPFFMDAWDEFMFDGYHYTHLGYKLQGQAMARSVVNYLNF